MWHRENGHMGPENCHMGPENGHMGPEACQVTKVNTVSSERGLVMRIWGRWLDVSWIGSSWLWSSWFQFLKVLILWQHPRSEDCKLSNTRVLSTRQSDSDVNSIMSCCQILYHRSLPELGSWLRVWTRNFLGPRSRRYLHSQRGTFFQSRVSKDWFWVLTMALKFGYFHLQYVESV